MRMLFAYVFVCVYTFFFRLTLMLPENLILLYLCFAYIIIILYWVIAFKFLLLYFYALISVSTPINK